MIKKIFPIILVLLLMAGCFTACSDNSDKNKDTDSESVSTIESDSNVNDGKTDDDSGDDGEIDGGGDVEDEGKNDNENVFPTNHKITATTAGVKVLGVRHLASENSLHMDWSCSGAEFTVDLKGEKMLFYFTVSADCYFRVWIDGEKYVQNGSEYLAVKANIGMLLLDGLSSGKHTIRIMKITGYTLARAELTGVSFAGSILADTDTSDKELYIEFIGDGITCGEGTVGEHGGAYTDQDGTLAYSYLLAEELDADYSMFALSGHRLVEQIIKKGTDGNIYDSMYLKTSHIKSQNTSYDFARQADIVVINIGTNDYSQSIGADKFEDYYYTLIQTVREKNGDDCKILCLYNANDTYKDALLSACEGFGGVSKGVSTYELDKAENNAHPSISEHAAYAAELKDVILNLPAPFTPALNVIPEGDGDLDGLDFFIN